MFQIPCQSRAQLTEPFLFPASDLGAPSPPPTRAPLPIPQPPWSPTTQTNHLPIYNIYSTPSEVFSGPRKQPQPWFLRAWWASVKGLPYWLAPCIVVPARTDGPTHASILLRRHPHAQPTSSQQQKPGMSSDSSKHRAQGQGPYS